MVWLKANRPALLQDGLVGRVQAFAHHGDGIVVVTRLLVVVAVVVILLLVSQQVGVQVSVCGGREGGRGRVRGKAEFN